MGQPVWAASVAYDPMELPSAIQAQVLDLSFGDTARQRELPLRVYLPLSAAPSPVLIFSHGLGGSRAGSAFLGRHWAGRGYVAVFMQHPGSDASVWQDQPQGKRMQALREAADLKNFMLRIMDVSVLIDQLGRWNRDGSHPLTGRLDLTRLGMSGHSFGALTTQAVSGQAFPGSGYITTDSRVKAAIIFSPSSPRNSDPKIAFGMVSVPWLLMTGTRDASFIGIGDVESRLSVFPSLPPGSKYELVLDGAEHSVFTDHALPGESGKRNPNHHRVILAISTAFWDAYLNQDGTARAWLDGIGPRTIAESADRWRRK